MTDKQRIKSILSEIEHGYISYDNLHGDDEQGLKLIKKALEKQIPTKPYAESYGDADGYPVWEYSCPVCGFGFGEDGDYLPKYCPDCGRAIDWEEVEE